MRARPGVRAAAALAVLAALGLAGGARAAERDLAPLLADLDGDGRLESISLVPEGLRIDGPAASRTLPLDAREIASADVDCDGRLDIVLDGGARWLATRRLTLVR